MHKSACYTAAPQLRSRTQSQRAHPVLSRRTAPWPSVRRETPSLRAKKVHERHLLSTSAIRCSRSMHYGACYTASPQLRSRGVFLRNRIKVASRCFRQKLSSLHRRILADPSWRGSALGRKHRSSRPVIPAGLWPGQSGSILLSRPTGALTQHGWLLPGAAMLVRRRGGLTTLLHVGRIVIRVQVSSSWHAFQAARRVNLDCPP